MLTVQYLSRLAPGLPSVLLTEDWKDETKNKRCEVDAGVLKTQTPGLPKACPTSAESAMPHDLVWTSVSPIHWGGCWAVLMRSDSRNLLLSVLRPRCGCVCVFTGPSSGRSGRPLADLTGRIRVEHMKSP